MRLLLIEDLRETVKGIMDYADEAGWEKTCCNFECALETVSSFDPDIVILDWMYDAEETERGAVIFETIWRERFRPVIIFSALSGTIVLPAEASKNPLVVIFPKGDEEPVIQAARQWSVYVPAIATLRHDMNSALINALRSIELFQTGGYPGAEVFQYMIGKRAANYFNEKDYAGNLPPWIQYIYPPISTTLLSGDILRKIEPGTDLKAPGQPSEYEVILSPSCDLSNPDDIAVLTARCSDKWAFSGGERYTREEMAGEHVSKKRSRQEKYAKLLNQGYNQSYVALPEINGVLPHLTISLKSLNYSILKSEIVLDKSNIERERYNYYRVASIDSPFREQLIWAHMLNSCRPGVPVRDTMAWAEGVLTP